MKTTILALALLASTTTADPSNLRAGGDRRRLADKLDMHRLAKSAEDGQLGRKINFKLDPSHREDPQLAEKIAEAIDCGSNTATRIFRDVGKHEADHKAAGLDMWYEVTCTSNPDAGKTKVAKKTFKALKKFLEEGDHDGVVFVKPELEHATSWTPNDPQYSSQPHYDAINMAGA